MWEPREDADKKSNSNRTTEKGQLLLEKSKREPEWVVNGVSKQYFYLINTGSVTNESIDKSKKNSQSWTLDTIICRALDSS